MNKYYYCEECYCENCTEYFRKQDLEAELEIERDYQARFQPPKETPYDRPTNQKPPAPIFFPHHGSPTVVEEEDGPHGPGGLGADSDAEAPGREVDQVNHPSHYQSKSGIEAIQVIEAATEDLSGFEGYCTGNAMKYLFRWKKKGGKQDIEKAAWYLKRLLEGM